MQAVSDCCLTVLDTARLGELERDYREMREMFFEEPPALPMLVQRLRRLEDEITEKKGG